MAISYNIASGSTILKVESNGFRDKISVEVISDSALDAPIKLTLKQSNTDDGTMSHALPEVPITTDAGANSNLLQSKSFYLSNLFLDIDVLTATVGTLEIYVDGK